MAIVELIFAFLVAFVLAYVVYWIYQRNQTHQVFRRMGVPGPTPSLLGGNLSDVNVCTMQPIESNERWRKQYGKVYGYFVGGVPTLVVGDLELAKKVAIKDANNFINRPTAAYELPISRDSLTGIRGERWKEVRSVLTPTFSSGKMKQLSVVVSRTITVFMDKVDQHATIGSEFDIYDMFQRLTLDVIGKCALATVIDSQQQEDNVIFNCVNDTMKGTTSVLIRLLIYFPGLIHVMQHLMNRAHFVVITKELSRNLLHVLKERRLSPKKTIDMLQLMLEASSGHQTEDEANAEDSAEPETTGSSRTARGSRLTLTKPLTDNEIIGNCWVFLLAGFETTATTLAYVVNILVAHQDIQEKVYQEIMNNTDPDQIPTYEEAHSLQYLDQVINETLRLYPPVVLFMTRECAQDYDLNGIKIPAGMKIEIPIYSIHHDPELWPDPEKFDPERFSPENKSKIHPMAHIPFGAGPRNCIGMRFALLEAKLTLIRLIRKYRLEPCDKTKDPPEVTVPHATFVPKNGIYLKVVPRDY